jgi:hypothetical protein
VLHLDAPSHDVSSPRKRGSSRGTRRSDEIAEKSTRATKSGKPHSVVVSWMLANANRERERDTMFASAACGRLSAPTRLEAPKDFQQMRRTGMALNFDWRASAECYDALYREIDARRQSASAAS